MSEEKKENSSAQPSASEAPASPAPKAAPPAAGKPAASPAPAAAAAKTAEPPPPPPPGEYGQALEKAGIPVQHLGKDASGQEMIGFAPADLLKGAAFLKEQAGFDLLLSCSGVDWKDRRESVYHLFSTKNHKFLAVKVTAENDHSPSLTPIWSAADWHERESYDLLGIHYDGHPNLSRILMPIDWLGHPLRKDYKVDDPRLVWNER